MENLHGGGPAAPVCVGVDSGSGTRDALALGEVLAEQLGLPVVSVHVATGEEGDADGLSADRVVRDDSGAAGLERFAEAEGAALLVVGSSTQTGLGRIRPGETATRLFAGASVAVAVAPAGYADRAAQLATIGCGYDDGLGARSALRWAVALCVERPDTRLEVLTVVPRLAFGGATVAALPSVSAQGALESEMQEDLDAAIAKAEDPSVIRGVRLAGDPVAALVTESERLDLLVLGSRGRGPVRSITLGSVSSEVVRGARCPVVVVPRPA